MATGKVIDYSFMEVSNIEGKHNLICHLDICVPGSIFFTQNTELAEVEPVNAVELTKLNINGQVRPTVAMRLCYNRLTSLSSNLIANLDQLSQGHARALRWIDLSFNQLSSIEVSHMVTLLLNFAIYLLTSICVSCFLSLLMLMSTNDAIFHTIHLSL